MSNFTHGVRLSRGLKPLVCMICLLGMVYPASAQDESFLLLTDSVDPTTGAVSLVWLDVEAGNRQPITSFNSPSYCSPALVTRNGFRLFYEPFLTAGFVYQVDLDSGGVLPFDAAAQHGLRCAAVNPKNNSMAWLHTTETGDQVVVTNPDGSNPIVLAQHTGIYDLLWSPDGEILLYTAVAADDDTFRPLISHEQSQNSFWARDAGLVVDYVWTPDGAMLVVAYYTQDNLAIGTLPRRCVISAGCQPRLLATFPLEASLRLSGAFSPTDDQQVVIREDYDPRGELQSDLYRLDLETGDLLRLTTSPNLIKTSVIWAEAIYFAASVFDPSTMQVSRSAIYRVAPQGGSEETVYQMADYFPQQILWSNR